MSIRPRLILCPVDFSDHSRRAFEYALGLAALHRAQLVVHTSIDPLLAEAAAARIDRDYVHDTRSELEEFIGRPALHRAPWAPCPRLVVTIGEPADQILEVAAFYRADLIVMGAQGLGEVDTPVIGWTSDDVLRRTAIPVLVVPRKGRPLLEFTREGPRVAPCSVVAAVDLRNGSSAVAGAGADLAGFFNGPLVLVHAVPPVEAPARWSACRADATRVQTAAAGAELEELAASLMAPVEPLVVASDPARAIVETAASRGAGLIVMGIGSANGGPRRLGSTAYRVLSFTTVPVLALPPESAGATERDGWLILKEVFA